MGATHIKKKIVLLIVGVVLGLFTLPLFMDYPSDSYYSQDIQNTPLEFTDIRTVRPDLSVPHYEPQKFQRVTIEADFNFNSAWCQWNDPMALPCPRPTLGQATDSHEMPGMNGEAISSL